MQPTPITLAQAFGLRPLDRVQLNNAQEIEESRMFARRGQHFDQPFYYFQRVLADGKIEVRSPGGYATSVELTDICDIVRGEPVVVRAMPRHVFMARNALPFAERQKAPAQECFAEAYVLYAEKNKWRQVDALVWFKDEALNADRPIRGILASREDSRLLQGKAKRTIMPVQHYRSFASYSADHGVARAQEQARAVVEKLISAAHKNHPEVVAVLASLGDKKIGLAALNRMAA